MFDFNPDTKNTTSGDGSGCGSKIDNEAMIEYQLSKLPEGKHDLIGVISNIYELGTQPQDRQSIPYDDKAKKENGWRLELNEEGKQKDLTAKLETRTIKGKETECISFVKQDTPQVAIAVDFPEVMLNLGQFFGNDDAEEKPLRGIIGEEGFIPKSKWGKNVLAKPTNIKHSNVNRNIEGAKPHYALAKNSMLYNMAEWSGAIESGANFHNYELGALIKKSCNFEVEVKKKTWETNGGGQKLEISIKPVSKLSPRDEKYYKEEVEPLLTDDLFGVLTFKGDNDKDVISKLRKKVFNTMKLSTNFSGSPLEAQIREVKPAWFEGESGQASESSSQKSNNQDGQSPSVDDKPAQSDAQEPEPSNSDDIDLFDDDLL